MPTCPLKCLGQARSWDMPFKMLGTGPSTKIYENLRKSTKIYEKREKRRRRSGEIIKPLTVVRGKRETKKLTCLGYKPRLGILVRAYFRLRSHQMGFNNHFADRSLLHSFGTCGFQPPSLSVYTRCIDVGHPTPHPALFCVKATPLRWRG